MTRQSRFITALIGMAGLVISLGCTPQHPFYLGAEKPVPSTSVTASTKIEYPDTEVESLNEVNLAQSPYSLTNSNPKEIWDLTLEEAIRYALENSKVMRNLGGVSFSSNGSMGVPSSLTSNPASAMTNYHAVAKTGLKRLCGREPEDCFPSEIRVALKEDFSKKSKMERWVRGRLDLSDGTARIDVPKQQKNSALSSTVGCDVMAVIPAGSGPLPAGTVLKGYLMN